jgi:hypothetical protein
VVAGLDAGVPEIGADPGGPLIEPAVRQATVAADERLAVADGVGHRFEQIREVVLHGSQK